MIKFAQPIAVDAFCGVGGLSLGFHRSGFDVLASIDLDPVNVTSFSSNFPQTLVIQADISKITAVEIRRQVGLSNQDEIDVVFGGPPCQGFSFIGKRKTDDPRNQLLVTFASLIGQLKPRYFVIENVAGLMHGAARATLARALRLLRASGYRWVTPIRILNAKDYGVPQVRKRTIVLGYRSDQLPPKYPRKKSESITVRDAIRDLYGLGRRKSLLSSDVFRGKLPVPSGYAKSLRGGSGRQISLTGCQLCDHTKDTIRRFRGTVPGRVEPISRFFRLHPGRPATTLRAGTGKERGSFTAARPIHPTQARCITVREAARLHSFPDWFEFHGTQWRGFQQVGNSVPPKLAESIARSVLRAIRASNERG